MISKDIAESPKRKLFGNNKESIVLQDRDFEIFIWLLDQKFSDLETLKRKFFLKDGESLGGVRTRMQKLEANGYVHSKLLDVGSTKKYYVATKKAHKFLSQKFTFTKFPSAVKEISPVTFIHDKYVLLSRIYLEEQGRATHWKAERRLKAILSSNGQNISREFMPDGIFNNKNGELTAFELENSPKNHERYKKKIEKFYSIMNGINPPFRFCLYITTSEVTKLALKKISYPFAKHFLIQTFDELKSASDTKDKSSTNSFKNENEHE